MSVQTRFNFNFLILVQAIRYDVTLHFFEFLQPNTFISDNYVGTLKSQLLYILNILYCCKPRTTPGRCTGIIATFLFLHINISIFSILLFSLFLDLSSFYPNSSNLLEYELPMLQLCYICEESGRVGKATTGACMQCNKSGCKQYFHVTW